MSKFRNAPAGPVRMDLRPQNDPATQAGMRGVHRGMGGGVIGGYTPAGEALGTKRMQGPADGSRIGNPSTPGLDRWRQMNPNAPKGQAAITAASGNGVRTAAAPEGSQLLKDRQELHARMKAGVTPGMQQQARKLGVTDASWKRVAAKMPHTMAMMPGAKRGGGMRNVTPTTPPNDQGAVQGGEGGKPYLSPPPPLLLKR